MNTIVELPSGKVFDLRSFVALLPIQNDLEKSYELILSGHSSSISLEKSDGEALLKWLKIDSYFQDLEQSSSEKTNKNNAIYLLKKWIEREKNRQSTPAEKEYFEEF